MKKVTASDLRSLQYFWEQKDDLERDVSWNELQAGLQAEYPEIVKAWTDYKVIRTTLTAVLQFAVDRAERDGLRTNE